MVACGHFADECPRRSHSEQRQNSPSSRADMLWYESVPCRRKNLTDGLLDGDVLNAEAYADTQAREDADIQALAASLYPETDEEATDGDATDISEGSGRERVHFADQPANQARPPRQPIQQAAAKQAQAKARPRPRRSALSSVGFTVRRTNGRSSAQTSPLETYDSDDDDCNHKTEEWFGLVDPTDESVRSICPSHGLQAVEMTGKRVRKTIQKANRPSDGWVGALQQRLFSRLQPRRLLRRSPGCE
jgi:hypothetical protein